MGTPYLAIAKMFSKGMSQNIAGAQDDSQRINNDMVVKGGDSVNAKHQSPFGETGVGTAFMMPYLEKTLPGLEKMVPANTQPLGVAQGGSSPQQQPFSTKMQDYLNYMKYRG